MPLKGFILLALCMNPGLTIEYLEAQMFPTITLGIESQWSDTES